MYQTGTRTGPSSLVVLILGGLLLLVALSILGGATESGTITIAPASSPSAWLTGNNVQVSNKLTLSEHSKKHGDAATELYVMMLTGKCAASMTFCGGSVIEKLHICIDPVTGAVGAVLQFGMEITTGYYEGNLGYWQRRVARENWEVCSDD